MARRLRDEVGLLSYDIDIGDTPLPDAAVNHWMIYTDPWLSNYSASGFYSGGFQPPGLVRTMTITHIDDAIKGRIVHEAVGRAVDVGICMSSMTREALIQVGVDADRLCVIPPAHDGVVHPRRIVVGITSRAYPDGRKREWFLTELAGRVNLEPFHFEIHGSGWDRAVAPLERAGATVDNVGESGDFEQGYRKLRNRIPYFDYYLYLGMDEGSMGTLDALAAGVKTIITPQGFHVDIPGAITHGFTTIEELVNVFTEIAADRRRRTSAVSGLTWEAFGARHAELWEQLLNGASHRESQGLRRGRYRLTTGSAKHYGRQLRSVRRALRSELLPVFWKSRRYWLRGFLSRTKGWWMRLVDP